MSMASVHVIFAITRRLILRSATIGAFVGLIAGLGMFVIVYAQAALDPERFAGWNENPGQWVIFAVGGAIVGTGLGLASGLGALFSLRVRAAVTEPDRMHFAGTAGFGAGAAIAACTVLAFTGVGTVFWVSIGMSVGLGAVSACIAGLQTRRLLTASPSRTG
ncbi:hypothetical protein [Arthrobacter burdickii]|uniref:Uncharacterized protein n=1 Tax=Arthrobacter burdickii TaxID=3035920 RepID=A0ABT8JWM1_9MICC|nr:hypothetical protein [Arthrobacter burdickii]MDN4609573.1 hypothetical protein [Arthrobacter burdickii]